MGGEANLLRCAYHYFGEGGGSSEEATAMAEDCCRDVCRDGEPRRWSCMVTWRWNKAAFVSCLGLRLLWQADIGK
jgi:hypothetical protein